MKWVAALTGVELCDPKPGQRRAATPTTRPATAITLTNGTSRPRRIVCLPQAGRRRPGPIILRDGLLKAGPQLVEQQCVYLVAAMAFGYHARDED